jgi:ABC-2 type transport system permease protein
MRALFARNLRRHAVVLAALVAGLFAFEGLLVWVTAKIELGPGLRLFLQDLLPPRMKEMIASQGGAFTFPGAVAFGFQHPVALVATIAFAALAGTIPAAERESGFLDLVLAGPVPRARYLAAVIALLAAGAAVLPLAILGGAALGLSLVRVGDALPWWRYAPCAGGMAALLATLGAGALFLAAGARRRASALGPFLAIVLALFFLEHLADIWSPAAAIRWLSPFHFFKPIEAVVVPRTPPQNPAVLGGAAVALLALAAWRFRRQDI